jgi:CheY-like chemotaxis protein
VRAFLVDALEDLGHEASAYENGEAALARIRDDCPDLVLLDFAMPGMNGAELARRARAVCPDLPIVIVTGYAESGQLEAALGPDVQLLHKPFTIDRLAACIAQNLGVAALARS